MLKRLGIVLPIVAALLLSAPPVRSWFVGGGELQGFHVGESTIPATVTFLQCANDSTNLTTYTFAAQNVGTATADRYTAIGIASQDNAITFGVSSVTVGGASATEIADQAGAGSLSSSAIYILSNPSGTSEDVVVTFSEAIADATICLWQVNNLLSGTAVDTAVGFSTNASAITLDTDTAADGITVGICDQETGAQSTTWTGLTERVDASSASESWSAADFDEDGTAAVPLSITCDYTGVDDTTGAIASFR